jgi:hypothetical protein
MSNLPDDYDHAAFVAAYEGEAPVASLGAAIGYLITGAA